VGEGICVAADQHQQQQEGKPSCRRQGFSPPPLLPPLAAISNAAVSNHKYILYLFLNRNRAEEKVKRDIECEQKT